MRSEQLEKYFVAGATTDLVGIQRNKGSERRLLEKSAEAIE